MEVVQVVDVFNIPERGTVFECCQFEGWETLKEMYCKSSHVLGFKEGKYKIIESQMVSGGIIHNPIEERNIGFVVESI